MWELLTFGSSGFLLLLSFYSLVSRSAQKLDVSCSVKASWVASRNAIIVVHPWPIVFFWMRITNEKSMMEAERRQCSPVLQLRTIEVVSQRVQQERWKKYFGVCSVGNRPALEPDDIFMYLCNFVIPNIVYYSVIIQL